MDIDAFAKRLASNDKSNRRIWLKRAGKVAAVTAVALAAESPLKSEAYVCPGNCSYTTYSCLYDYCLGSYIRNGYAERYREYGQVLDDGTCDISGCTSYTRDEGRHYLPGTCPIQYCTYAPAP